MLKIKKLLGVHRPVESLKDDNYFLEINIP